MRKATTFTSHFILILYLLSSFRVPPANAEQDHWNFSFQPGESPDGMIHVSPDAPYSENIGYGFELGTRSVDGKPFYFSAAVPQGNYNVTITLGDSKSDSTTTVKAELRRLMLQNIHTPAGEFDKRTITVNVRRPEISTGGKVTLKGARESVVEAWAWDNKLTLEFDGQNPAVAAIQIARAEVPTLFILGDSTSCDQPTEPFTSWGQSITRFLKPGIAVANHGESGESLTSSLRAHRLEKVLDAIKPGDYLFIQYGHNDQKEKGPGVGAFTTYKASLKRFVDAARSKGATPVLITPVSRKKLNTLGDFPAAVRGLATEEKVPLIDLNAMSETLYKAFGPARLDRAFVDGTHHTAYGSYEIAKCVITGIQRNKLDLARFIVDDFKNFDPTQPDAIDDINIPASPNFSTTQPLGN